MATVEKVTPPPPPVVVKIALSMEEARSLYTLLADGVHSKALDRLKLRGLNSALAHNGFRSDMTVGFNYIAEID